MLSNLQWQKKMKVFLRREAGDSGEKGNFWDGVKNKCRAKYKIWKYQASRSILGHTKILYTAQQITNYKKKLYKMCFIKKKQKQKQKLLVIQVTP